MLFGLTAGGAFWFLIRRSAWRSCVGWPSRRRWWDSQRAPALTIRWRRRGYRRRVRPIPGGVGKAFERIENAQVAEPAAPDRPVVAGVGDDVPVEALEAPHGARHVAGAGDENPDIAGLGLHHPVGIQGVLGGVTALFLREHALGRKLEAFEGQPVNVAFALFGKPRVPVAAAEQKFGFGVLLGETDAGE